MARIIKYYFAGAASTAAEVMKVDTGKTGIIDKATRASYHQDDQQPIISCWEAGSGTLLHGDGFPFPANPYNRCLAEAALSYLPEGDPMVLRI